MGREQTLHLQHQPYGQMPSFDSTRGHAQAQLSLLHCTGAKYSAGFNGARPRRKPSVTSAREAVLLKSGAFSVAASARWAKLPRFRASALTSSRPQSPGRRSNGDAWSDERGRAVGSSMSRATSYSHVCLLLHACDSRTLPGPRTDALPRSEGRTMRRADRCSG